MLRPATTLAALTGLAMPLLAVLALSAAPATAAGEACDGRPATIVIVENPSSYATDPVVGTPGDDVIVGTSRRDTVDGAGGNDVICGLDGDDHLSGGPGNDRLFGGQDQDYSPDDGYYGDLLVPGPGDDHVDLGADPDSVHLCFCDSPDTVDRVSYEGATAGVSVDLTMGVATGEGTDTIVGGGRFGVIGSPFDDHLVGTTGNNLIMARGGADTVTSGAGNDFILLDDRAAPSSNDTLDAGAGRDVIYFAGGDTIDAGADKDYVNGYSGGDHGSVRGGGDRDRIAVSGPISVRGGGDNDQLFARLLPEGGYVLHGGAGRDRLFLRVDRLVPEGRITVSLPRRRIVMPRDSDSVRLAAVEDLSLSTRARKNSPVTFIGSKKADRFFVSQGASVRAFGRGGNDVLSGANGNDLLDGGPGRDSLAGDSGRDRCVRGEKVTQCEARR